MKRTAKAIIIICVFLLLLLYLYYELEDAELASGKTREIHKGDFVMHIQVERMDEGFRVYRSVQYTGEDPVTVKHQTPLISLSFKRRNHDYTGSTVAKTLKKGSTYHPQDPKTFKAPNEGEHMLFCESVFKAGKKEVTIQHEEKLVFE
ncbi:hypothetical protein [Lentibacillus juripiscarius]|uniref:EfeO-type cupredoxin-like domain-containing protein n=1 Tax=Lentibacillus juripiscarius TaxID=257446 RepID=A0ABW5V976_9BACI